MTRRRRDSILDGAGPHSTPLIIGNVLYAMSSLKQLFAIDKSSGKLIWSHDLIKEFGAPPPGRGYSASPIQYQNTVIVPGGGSGQALFAFDLKTGALAWKNGSYDASPASPILIDVSGQPQLVVFGGDLVVGVNPSNGAHALVAPAQDGLGIEHQHAGLGRRQSAAGFVRVQQRRRGC